MGLLRDIHSSLTAMLGGKAAWAIEIGAIILVLALIGIFLRWRLSDATRRQRTVRRRFDTLATAHNMMKPDRQLLLEMARQLGLEEPSMLFVRRALFETASARIPCDPMQVDAL